VLHTVLPAERPVIQKGTLGVRNVAFVNLCGTQWTCSRCVPVSDCSCGNARAIALHATSSLGILVVPAIVVEI
jgi:hypothetical protein